MTGPEELFDFARLRAEPDGDAQSAVEKVTDELEEALDRARETGRFWLPPMVAEALRGLPPQLREVGSLVDLSLSHTHLRELPEWIGEFSELQSLDLASNPLRTLPQSLAQLGSLRVLGLSQTRLESFEPIAGLEQLEALVLAGVRIGGPPEWIGRLVNLRELDLGATELTELPSGIGNLQHLTQLRIWGNQLTELPDELRKLRRLEVLEVSAGGTADLRDDSNHHEEFLGNSTPMSRLVGRSHGTPGPLVRLPEWLDELQSLRALFAGGQPVASVPESLPPTLEGLFLARTALTAFPRAVLALPRLRRLDLRDNRIEELPSALGGMSTLETLDLVDNPLALPPEVLAEHGRPARIIEYLQRVQGPTRRLDQAKLLVVGEGAVGKTSLIKRLVHGDFSPHEQKTEGIDVSRWALPVGGDSIEINIWDFGGQEIMHATHQFFLTKRSVYILVVNARQAEEQNRVEYWLKLIQSFSDSSPVILVGNKVEESVLDIDARGLRAKYPNIVDIVPVSCKTGQGIDEVQRVLSDAVGRLDHVRDVLPATFFDVKQELERLDDDYLPYADYEEICRRHGISASHEQELLIGFLHDLGTALCFRDDPRLQDTNILNPEWVTGGVYRLLNSNTAAQRKGLLDWNDVDSILDSADYPASRRAFIVDMMKRFELCFESEGTFLVPDLLTKQEPDTGSWDGALQFEITYDVLPSSVLSRLIVRMHQHISSGTVWRTGMVLTVDANRALVKADREDAVIRILVDGPSDGRRGVLTAIRSELRAIGSTIPGLEGEERVPVPGHPGIWVPYSHLLELETAGRDEVVPQGLTEDFLIRDLLAGIERPDQRANELQRTAVREPATPPAPEGTADVATPWTPEQGIRLGWFLLAAFVVAAAVIVGSALLGGPGAAALSVAAIAVVVVIAAFMLRSSGRLSEQGLLDAVREALARDQQQDPPSSGGA